MKKISAIFASVFLIFTASSAYSQDYPSKPFTLVVPFSPGGANDTLGRYLAAALEKHWGKSVVVENRPGAGSAIGSAHVAKATPDGHTALFVSSTLTTNAATQGTLPFDPANDLIPVGAAATGQFMMAVSNKVKATNLQEFIEEAKSREMFFATTGVGSSTQFAGELFNERAGLKMTPVHFKGGGEAIIDLTAGRVDVYFGTVTQVAPGIQSKMFKGIAVTSSERSPVMPDVPTVAEGGITGAETQQWWGVFLPAGTPDAIVASLNAAINEVMQKPEAAEFLAKLGANASPMTPAEFRELVHGELVSWKKLAEERGIKPE